MGKMFVSFFLSESAGNHLTVFALFVYSPFRKGFRELSLQSRLFFGDIKESSVNNRLLHLTVRMLFSGLVYLMSK